MDFEQILKRFPFLSIIKAGEKEYVGIIQQSDTAFIMFYDYSLIKDKKLKETFISLGETWWWESNRRIPITLFLHNQMKEFYPYLTVLAAKNVKVEQDSKYTRPTGVPRLIGNTSKFRKITGWKPTIPIDKILNDTLEYWRDFVKNDLY